MVSNFRTALAAAVLLGASLGVYAAGLGKLTVNSALGQPLNAEIDLVSIQPGEADSLTARVASPDAFREARIEYTSSLRLLRFAVEKRPNGQPYLKVSSVGPINEPFIDALIEVTWPAGRIQREYPILLDPPGYAQARVAPPSVAAAPKVAASAPATTPAASAPATPAAVNAPSTSAAAEAGAPSAQAELEAGKGAASASDTYGPVERGETLSKIAGQVKPAEVSLEQMLVAMYRENKTAFAGDNMNRLKTGQILKVPSAEEVSQVTPAEAGKEIRTQVADWKSYREQLAGGVASIPARADSSNAAAGRIASAAVTPAAPPSAETPRDTLKLSKSSSGNAAAAGKGAGGTQDRLNALQEELTAKNKSLSESQSRVADLEKQIRDMQRLLDLKGGVAAKPGDTQVAALTPAPAPAKPDTPSAASTPAPPATTSAASEPAKPPEMANPPPAAPVSPTATATPPQPPAASPKPKVARKPVPPPSKGFMDELLDNPAYLAAGVGVLALLAIVAFVLARRRRERAEGPSSAMTSAFPSDLKPDTNTGRPAGGLVDTGNSSFLTDFDKTGPGTIDTDEVDPVAEAEVYIAYGRDAQAEEILREAMARDKNRHEIALKLLEIYHARKSATAFETVAKELRAAVGESHPLWQKAAAMGAQIDPTNPLYVSAASGTSTFTAMSPPAAPAAAPKPNLDFDLDSSSSAHGAASSAPAPSFDLDLDASSPSTSSTADIHSEHESPSSSGLDFDLAPSAPSAPPMDVPADSSHEEKPAFDFDLSGLDFPSSKPAEAPRASAPAAASVDLADLSLDTPSGPGGEAVGTKLELAKAYLEIGDKDGARDILHEVAKEGSSAQKEEAKKLIASL